MPARDLIERSLAPPIRGEAGAVKRALRKFALRLGRAQARHQQQIDRELLASIERLQAELQPQMDELRGWLQAMRGGAADADTRLKAIENGMTQLVDHVRDHGTWMTGEVARIDALEARQATDTPLYGTSSFSLEKFDAGPAGTVVGFRETTDRTDGPDGVYRGFEDFFRGPEELIRERQRRYVPLLQGRGPVLDVGCGRGEFLELLRDAGIGARGVDLDPGMVERCHNKGLGDVALGDAVSHLESLEPASLGTVFASHVIEHLAYDELLRFISLSREKLVPGGLLVVETVNPHSPQALKHFWIDPTHRHPLFPEVVVALCWLSGYASGYLWHPGGSGEPERDRLQQGDYSVVAETATEAR